MPPVTYTHDLDTTGRLNALEERVRRLESGELFPGKSVLSRAVSSLVGPWPKSANFTVANPNSAILVFMSGTLFTAGAGDGTLQLQIDSVVVDSSTAWFTTVKHMPVPTFMWIATGLAAGVHTATLSIGSGTSDSNDKAKVLILELPQ
jgi:hypothetical protein